MEKYELINVFTETKEDVKNGFYRCFNEDTYCFDIIEFKRLRTLGGGSKMFKSISPIPKDKLPYYEKTKIYTENKDIIEKAIELGSKAAILNPASRMTPGGGVERGSKACEEEICRRTNLIYSLYSFTDYKDLPYQKKSEFGRYPLEPKGGIYSPYVSIYRKSGTYEKIYDPFYTNIITVSAVNHPILDDSGNMIKSMVFLMKDKIRTILRIAILGKHSKLALTAFGCGAYGCPSRQVARIFKEVLEENEFKHSFEEIVFCILDDKNAIRENNKDGNYKPFLEIFN